MGRIGAHVSVAGGLRNAFERAEDLGCQAMQIFTRNQRQWSAPPLTEEAIRAFRVAHAASDIGPVVAHGSYLVNLAHPDDAAVERSRQALLDEAQRAEALGCEALIIHPGAHLGQGLEYGLARVAESLDWLSERWESPTTWLLLENTAGQGTVLARTLEELEKIIGRIRRSEKIGLCLDTAHAFAGGLDLRDPNALEKLIRNVDQSVGLHRLRAFHLNDSRSPLASRVDRHEVLGQGELGEAPFRWLVQDKRFEDRPMIIEIPGDSSQYQENLNLLRSFQSQ